MHVRELQDGCRIATALLVARWRYGDARRAMSTSS